MRSKCPRCGAPLKENMEKCPRCGLYLISTDKASFLQPLPMRVLILRVLAVLAGILITVSLGIFAGVRIHYWRQARRVEEEYVNHTIEAVTLSNGYAGHAISFFGTDGDAVYLEELGEKFLFVGGVARVEFAAYIWFVDDATDVESAELTFSPIYMTAGGAKTRLPTFSMSVPVPEAPIKLLSPTTSYVNVITSIATINMNVLYGSQVIINGEDVSDKVDRSGGLSLNVNVYPIGENNISIVVRTDAHKEARRDLVFYRQEMDINLELATSVSYSSTLSYMTIVGKTEPGAWITVDTDYDTSSLKVNQETGDFSFRAKFSTYGNNLVSFHASMNNRRDSVISFFVNYVPAKAEYSRNAWVMDYEQVRKLYEQWNGRVFLCKGKIVDMYYEGDTQYSVMDVGKDTQQLIILENQSDVGSLNIGAKYEVYADVAGRLLYRTNYYPYLIGRYASLIVETK